MDSRDLNLLLTLDALLQEANVTLAARRLGLSTPATSHALARIRERMGDPLLVRSGRKMVLTRRVRLTVPFFLAGLHLAAQCDDVLTVSERAARQMASRMGLRLVAAPLPLAAYGLHLLWHPRLEADPANRWLREVFMRAAEKVARRSSSE